MTVTVTWTQEKVRELRKQHDKAAADGVEQFTFDGNEYVTRYAYYLLQYLEPKFGLGATKVELERTRNGHHREKQT